MTALWWLLPLYLKVRKDCPSAAAGGTIIFENKDFSGVVQVEVQMGVQKLEASGAQRENLRHTCI